MSRIYNPRERAKNIGRRAAYGKLYSAAAETASAASIMRFIRARTVKFGALVLEKDGRKVEVTPKWFCALFEGMSAHHKDFRRKVAMALVRPRRGREFVLIPAVLSRKQVKALQNMRDGRDARR